MVTLPRLKRLWESLMAIGAYPGETDVRRGKRRIVVGWFFFSALTRAFAVAIAGVPGEAVVDLSAAIIAVLFLGLLQLKPDRFLWIVNAALFLILVEVLAVTIILGGLVPSGAIVLFGLWAVIGALILLSPRSALLWLLAFLFTLVLAVVLPERIEAVHDVEGSAEGIALTIAGVTIFVFAGMAYFVRQRDRLQQESDDLLHNILPDEIATRLKTDDALIADDYESASVTPPQLIRLLNDVFATFDGFVEELGLENGFKSRHLHIAWPIPTRAFATSARVGFAAWRLASTRFVLVAIHLGGREDVSF